MSSNSLVQRTIPHCRPFSRSQENDSKHFNSDEEAFIYARQNNFNIVLHKDGPNGNKRLYYFAKRDLMEMNNLHSVTLEQNKSAYAHTTWIIRLD